MIYAVEGNVNVGKTTFINEFAQNNNLKIISESNFIHNLQPLERQFNYIKQEVDKRKQNIENDIIMDRTILSVYLYTMISNNFKTSEKSIIVSLITELIKNNKIIIPEKLFFIIYPFELINKNHSLLKKQKNTQELLVDYDYYIKYNCFFSKLIEEGDSKIIKTENYRQIIELSTNNIFFNLKDYLPQNEKILIIDGIEDKNSLESLNDSDIIKKIIYKINNLNKNNQKEYNSFLSDIIKIMDNKQQKEKIEIIDSIMIKIPLYKYISKIIYIKDREEKNKIDFYNALNERMGEKSNISIIDKDNIDYIEYSNIKEVMLVDLFYYIRECIKKGKI